MRVSANAPEVLPPAAEPKKSVPSLSRARVTRVSGARADERMRRSLAESALGPAQAKSAVNTGYGDLIAATRALHPTGMPAPVRATMKGALGADFSNVRVHPGSARAVQRKGVGLNDEPALESVLQRKCAGCEDEEERVQRKGEGAPDAMADRVMGMAEPGPIGSAPSAIQRKCAKCEENTARLIPAPATHSTHDSSQKPLASGDAVLATAAIAGGGTDEMHEQLVDDYTKATGVDNQPGLQYTKGYADWLKQQGGKSPPPTPCQISVKYSNPKQLDCDTIWMMTKGTLPPEPLCGAGLVYDIVSVSASGSGCPKLDGLLVSETVTGDKGCTPPGFVWPAPKPCTIGPGGSLTGCTDSYTLCGPTRNLQGSGCTEVVTQNVLVGGKVAETHKITFKLSKTASGCTGTVTRS